VINQESEVKFVVSKEDIEKFLTAGARVSSGQKFISYYDDESGVLATSRATFRRRLKGNVLLDELKTLSSWDSRSRVCQEIYAPATTLDPMTQSLCYADMSREISDAVADLLGSKDFVLRRSDSVTFTRTLLAVDGIVGHFDVDECVTHTGATFYEIEFESDDDKELASAAAFIKQMCKSAELSTLSKRERVRSLCENSAHS